MRAAIALMFVVAMTVCGQVRCTWSLLGKDVAEANYGRTKMAVYEVACRNDGQDLRTVGAARIRAVAAAEKNVTTVGRSQARVLVAHKQARTWASVAGFVIDELSLAGSGAVGAGVVKASDTRVLAAMVGAQISRRLVDRGSQQFEIDHLDRFDRDALDGSYGLAPGAEIARVVMARREKAMPVNFEVVIQ